MSGKNNLRAGRVRFLVFWSEEDQVWYGYAFEFGIMVDADTKAEAIEELDEALIGHLESLSKAKIREQEKIRLVNQKGDKQYEKIWDRLTAKQAKSWPDTKKISEPVVGYMPLPSFA